MYELFQRKYDFRFLHRFMRRLSSFRIIIYSFALNQETMITNAMENATVEMSICAHSGTEIEYSFVFRIITSIYSSVLLAQC